ncbi:MAG TPA: BTAD domain-containing putative transcriptional regulator, partial [Streptosporangiaceae bacterium]|nr:BTAD domain-containing putative transcriptional regulator [Streptosporangiaceae bacterium]
MEFRILGNLEVHAEGCRLAVGGPREQKVLAALLLDAGRLVPLSRLVDVVWEDDPPATAAKQVRNAVSALRRLLTVGGPGPVITTEGAGYRLSLGGAVLDARLFETQAAQAAAAASAGRSAEAAGLLRSALDLWRGPALAGLSGRAVEAAAEALERRRLAVAETYCDHLLALGRDREAAAELAPLVASHPLQERSAARLMVALYRDGQRADALALYQDTRRVLADELGLDPGPELQELHQQILTDNPALTLPHLTERDPQAAGSPRPSVVPRQLPAGVPHFTGRSSELKSLTALLDPGADTPSTVVVSALAGTAGVGKTALAVHWAHQRAHRFPDGQLYVNLHGFGPSVTPLTPTQAIRGFLDALAVPPERIPTDLAAQAGLYRSLLAGKRMLVLLDNACDAAQVRPLLPGSPGCLVLVTSRSQLTGLVAAEGAHLYCLDVLAEGEAGQLLAARIGHDRASAEPAAVTELARLCAGLPLALAITAARAAARPNILLATLAAELHDASARLDVLDTDDAAASLRTVFTWSYQQLTQPAAQMFRLLGVHPGPSISLPAAASLCGTPREAARSALGELTYANLLNEPVSGRFTFHDLLRAYAAECARAEDSVAERHAATRRVLDHYLHTGRAARLLMTPTRPSIAVSPPALGTTPEDMINEDQAFTWFEAEHQVLLATTGLASDSGLDSHAWQIPWTMEAFLNYRGYWQNWMSTQRSALAAAQRLGDPTALASAHTGLGGACLRLRQFDDAHAHFAQASDFYEQAGDRHGQAMVHIHRGSAYGRQRQWRDALGQAMQGLELFRAMGLKAGQAMGLNDVGWWHAQLGEYDQALALCQQALELNRELGNHHGIAVTLHSVGYMHHHLGQYAEAADCYRCALTILHQSGARYRQATVLADLGETLHAAANSQAAREV